MEKQIIKITETSKINFDVDHVVSDHLLSKEDKKNYVDEAIEEFNHNHTEGTTYHYILIDSLIKELEKQKSLGNNFVLFENANYDVDLYFYKAEITTTNDTDFLKKTERENKTRLLEDEFLQRKIDLKKEFEKKLEDLN